MQLTLDLLGVRCACEMSVDLLRSAAIQTGKATNKEWGEISIQAIDRDKQLTGAARSRMQRHSHYHPGNRERKRSRAN